MRVQVSVIVVIKNEASRIAACLHGLRDFDDIWVVDSVGAQSEATAEIVSEHDRVRYVSFDWNGQYPKKRQWCLDYLDLKHDWVLFVDADEFLTPELVDEICRVTVDSEKGCLAGYYIVGRYRIDGRILKFGAVNQKLALIHGRFVEFPVVDDLDAIGMGEIEGHYQPVMKCCVPEGMHFGRLRAKLIHDACDDWDVWRDRHVRYAQWARYVAQHGVLPRDDRFVARMMKSVFGVIPLRSIVYFIYAYVLRLGFLDGFPGLRLAWEKGRYYAQAFKH